MKSHDLYLDVDGVILRRTGRVGFGGRREFELAPRAIEFLDWCAGHFRCFWLTTRSRNGSYEGIERAFRHADPTTRLPDALKEAIQPAPWGKVKIEGIDMWKGFRWIDDSPDQVSLDRLERVGLAHCWIEVSTDRQPNDLERVQGVLQEAVKTNSSKTSKHPWGSNEDALERLERMGLGDGPLAEAYRRAIEEQKMGISNPPVYIPMKSNPERENDR